MKLILFLFVFPWGLWGQTTHSATLTWNDPNTNLTGTTYTVYRAVGACGSPTPNFVKLATGLTTTNYVDTTVTIGSYCFQVTATNSGNESGPSNQVTAPIPPFPPANVTITVQ